MFRRSSDFILVASFPSGAVSDFGLGSGCTASSALRVDSSFSTSFLAWASDSLRRTPSSLMGLMDFGMLAVASTSAAGLIFLVGLDKAINGDTVIGDFGLAILWSSCLHATLTGCFTGAIISQAGSVGLDGAEEDDIGRSIVICECPHSSHICLGEYAGVEGAESMKVPKDFADIGGDIGPGDSGVIGDDSAVELGKTMVENL